MSSPGRTSGPTGTEAVTAGSAPPMNEEYYENLKSLGYIR